MKKIFCQLVMVALLTLSACASPTAVSTTQSPSSDQVGTVIAATMQALCEGLVRLRVRPYYCYQAQLLEGTAQFRVPIERGVEIFRALRGRTSGFAIPHYVLDTPMGKVPISHPQWLGREGDDALLETWDGRVWRERNPL